MSSESPSGRDISTSASPGGSVRWLRVMAIVAILFFALLRWAVDVLLFVCVLVLVAHSTRDTLQDWLARESFEGEPDPVWAIGAVCIGLAGIAISGFWLLSSSETGGRLVDRYVPAVVTEAVAFGERLGWGGRAFWPGPSRFNAGPQGAAKVHRASIGSLDVSPPGTISASAPADADAERGRSAPGQAPVSTAGRLASSTTRLRSSATIVGQGTAVTFIAEVTATSRPSGSVTFRRGSKTLGTANVNADGRAALVLSDLPPGTHDISAEFLGSSTLRSSRSTPVQVTVR